LYPIFDSLWDGPYDVQLVALPKPSEAIRPEKIYNPHSITRATYGGLCGMPACGQAAGCGVCDTPEQCYGATGLCARIRACAGAADSLHTYIQHTMYVYTLLYNTHNTIHYPIFASLWDDPYDFQLVALPPENVYNPQSTQYALLYTTHPGVGGGTHRRRASFERC